ncbi:MAG: hypothetical protein EBY39_01515 [Flavobacteriia bacterium]|nr:hypothetical protein [Flavobacteriia bacterium]
MQFFDTQKAIKRVGPTKYVVGPNPLNPQLTLEDTSLFVEEVNAVTGLFISGVNFIDYVTGDKNHFLESRYELEEAFIEDANGDLTPSSSNYISDSMWILRNEEDLELRANHWRYNMGPQSFTEDISIGIQENTQEDNVNIPAPKTSNSLGYKGQVTYDENFMYVCTKDNEWKRSVLSDF